MEVNRTIHDCPDLDDVDHALGRPFCAYGGYRNRYITDLPDKKAKMRASEWWGEGSTLGDRTYFYVTRKGREALRHELQDAEKYGRVFWVSRVGEIGARRVVAKSRSAAKYAAYLNADVDHLTFMEFCKGLRVQLAKDT